MSTSLGHKPDGKWAFDESVTQCFDDMLRRSIPQYDVMRSAVFDLACRFVQPNTGIVDLGCSRGEALAPLVSKFGMQNLYYGVEVSAPMLEVCRQRFKALIDCNVVSIMDLDLRTDYPRARASVTLSILTLQFIPIEHRQRLLKRVRESTVAGGAFIVVEKVLGNTADIDDAMVHCYYDLKAANGYSGEEIERKRLSLEGVLVPVTAAWNEDLLRSSGFRHVDCFWRWQNFAGWVALA